MKILRLTFFVYCMSILNIHTSQDQLGMRQGNYSGLYGAVLNPANASFYRGKWDFNVGSLGFFVNNNYFLMKNTSTLHTLINGNNIYAISSPEREPFLPDGAIVFTQKTPPTPIFLNVAMRVDGPSFIYKINDHFTFGLMTSFRGNVSAYKIPSSIKVEPSTDLTKFLELVVDPFKGAAMAWSEISPTVSFKKSADFDLAIGFSPKILLGHESTYVRTSKSTWSLTQDTSLYYSGEWKFGFTEANLDESKPQQLKIAGSGLGLDLGFAIGSRKYALRGEPSYKWRAGIALIDLGAIRFTKQSSNYAVTFSEDNNFTVGRLRVLGNPLSSIRLFKDESLSDSTEAIVTSSYSVATPAAITANIYYQLFGDFYLGSVLVQRIPIGKNAVYRPSTFAVSSQIDHRWIGASTSLVLSDWKKLNVGFAARLAWFNFGSDNVLSIFKKQTALYGTDLYFGIKINDFSFCRKDREKKKSKKIKCAVFDN